MNFNNNNLLFGLVVLAGLVLAGFWATNFLMDKIVERAVDVVMKKVQSPYSPYGPNN